MAKITHPLEKDKGIKDTLRANKTDSDPMFLSHMNKIVYRSY